MPPSLRWLAIVWALGWFSLSIAEGAVLYDGALDTPPGQQGWFYLTNPIVGAKAVQSLVPDGVQVDSMPREDDQAGYFASLHPNLPTFDRSVGYQIVVDLKLLAESHSTVHRAGFSLVALSLDLRGIELGFWTDEVWAQSDSPLFRHAEGAAFDTTAQLARYALTILDDQYSLSVNGSLLLTGPLRDYSDFGLPYSVPNFLFLGDDTSSARATFQLARVAAGPIPDPPPTLIGDANGDCAVGAADYALWAAQFGQTGAELSADFDGSGSVGAGDYALWAANFGNTCPPAVQPVPEPATWLLACAGAIAVATGRNRAPRR